MKRILIIANSDGGLFKFRKELIEELLCSYNVCIASPKGMFLDRFVEMGCKIYITDIDRTGTNPLAEIALIRQYVRIIKLTKPDCVLTYTIKPNIYGGIICAARGIPYIANITGLGTVFSGKNLLQSVIVKMYRFSLRKARMVFFQNKANMEYMVNRNMVKGACDLLPGSGVNIEQYKPSEYPNQDTIDFLFVSRIMKEKGVDQYLKAAEVIRSKYPNTSFHVCGRCDKAYDTIIQQMHNTGTIIYHGLVKDMIPMYQRCACTVHPTYYPEGMSNVVLESCASARPVITTNINGCREIIEEGRNGFLCNPKDADDLIEKLERFLSLDWENRKKMGMYGRNKVVTEFDRRVVVNKYLEVIKNG